MANSAMRSRLPGRNLCPMGKTLSGNRLTLCLQYKRQEERAYPMRGRWSKKMAVGILMLGTVWLWSGLLSAEESPTLCLWTVQSETNTVYVLGSIHVLKQQHYPLAPAIYEALEKSDRVVFEVDLEELKSPQVQLKMLTRGFYANRRTLREALSASSYEVIEAYLSDRGLSIEAFQRVKPWMLAATITTLELQKLGFAPDQGVDRHLYAKAKANGKQIEGLETVEEQLNLFDHLSSKTQELFLLHTLRELSLLKRQTQEIVKAWKEGRVEGFERMLHNMQEFPEVYQALITDRNRRWFPGIESYLKDNQPCFVIVGTLHLLGEHGLLAMLETKGYTVRQL